MSEEYAGPATLSAGKITMEVQVRLSGRVDPVDGRYHWAGRVRAHDEVSRLARGSQRSVALRIGECDAVPARPGEVDAWGAVRFLGSSPPPWSFEETEV